MNFTGCIECGSLVIENEALRLCASCSHARRKAEKDELKKVGKRRKPIVKVSEKKQEKLKPYAVLRRNYLKENPVCELHLQGCTGNSEEIHHISKDESNFLNIKTWKATCRPCHDRCERILSAVKRRELGLLI